MLMLLFWLIAPNVNFMLGFIGLLTVFLCYEKYILYIK